MQYLNDLQYYEDRYDLFTIERCLDKIEFINNVIKKSRNSPEMKDIPEEEFQKNWNFVRNEQLLGIKLSRYEERENTIARWVEEDRIKQDKYDNTPIPTNIKCNKCKIKMELSFKHLDWLSDTPMIMEFFWV